MVKKTKKRGISKPLMMEDGKLKVTRKDFSNDIQELINEGKVYDKTILVCNDAYNRWIYKIENLFKCSFDHPENYLKSFDEIGCYPLITSNMNVEQDAHANLIMQLSFLESIIKKIHCIPSIKEDPI